MSDLKVLQKTEALHEGALVGAGRQRGAFIASCARDTVTFMPGNRDSVSSASIRDGKLYNLGYGAPCRAAN